jgi:hypothetical protein
MNASDKLKNRYKKINKLNKLNKMKKPLKLIKPHKMKKLKKRIIGYGRTTKGVASLCGKTLQNSKSSRVAKILAASGLVQRRLRYFY